jgi:hypothetical protein
MCIEFKAPNACLCTTSEVRRRQLFLRAHPQRRRRRREELSRGGFVSARAQSTNANAEGVEKSGEERCDAQHKFTAAEVCGEAEHRREVPHER